MGKKKTAKSKRPSFEQSLAELETIVANLEDGQLPLADSLEQYERGIKHLKSCYDQLATAERRIELVSKVDSSGKPSTEAFDDEASAALDEKGATRNLRRSTAKAKSRNHEEVDDASSLF